MPLTFRPFFFRLAGRRVGELGGHIGRRGRLLNWSKWLNRDSPFANRDWWGSNHHVRLSTGVSPANEGFYIEALDRSVAPAYRCISDNRGTGLRSWSHLTRWTGSEPRCTTATVSRHARWIDAVSVRGTRRPEGVQLRGVSGSSLSEARRQLSSRPAIFLSTPFAQKILKTHQKPRPDDVEMSSFPRVRGRTVGVGSDRNDQRSA